MSFLPLFLIFFSLNLLFRLPFILDLGFLNEDIALLTGTTNSLNQHGILFPFYSSLGPTMLRPWQWLGLASQWSLFKVNPLPPHLFTLFLLSLSQALLGKVLVQKAALLPTLFGLSLLGFARAGSESNFWISNQHDQYLLLAAALTLIAIEKVRAARSHTFLPLVFTALTFWFGFLANEKGVALPILGCLWFLAQTQSPLEKRALLGVTITAALSIITYFVYRYSIFSTLIGGYEDKVLPDALLSWSTVSLKILSLLLTPILQTSLRYTITLGAVFFFILLIGYLISPSKPSIRVIFLFLLALLVSSLPTLRYLPPPPHIGVFSTRMFWLPLIVWSIGLVFFFHRLMHKSGNSTQRWRGFILAFLLLSCSGFGGFQGGKQTATAHKRTLSLLQNMQEICPCVDPKRPSVTNLPQHIQSVNTFTEPGWLEHYALATGTLRCTQNAPVCLLEYRKKLKKLVHHVREKRTRTVSRKPHYEKAKP